MTSPRYQQSLRPLQQGVGLIEVMIALVLIVLTSMAVGNLQVSSMVSAKASSEHFALDQLSSEMLETLRAQKSDARSGLFDFDGAAQIADSPAEPVTVMPAVASWNSRLKAAIPTGIGSISCESNFCSVSISWLEEIDGSMHRQSYQTRTPL